MIRYRGKLIDEMTVDELRAALAECIRYAQATTQMHQEHITMLQNMISIDRDKQTHLFMEYAQ